QQEHQQQIEKEKHAAELALQNAQFALNRHISLTRVQPETYVIDHEVARVTAFPSLAANQQTGNTKTPFIPATPRPLQLPQPYDLLNVFRRLDISPDCIFLGKDEHSDLITIDAHDLCHGAFNAMTGGGKTTLERGILAQLLY